MIRDDLKKRVTQAMKEGDSVATTILRLALGEMQTAEARASAPLTDDDMAAVLRKLVKSNEETLALSGESADKLTLQREIELLKAFLPKGLTPDEIVAALAPVRDAIVSAKGDGQAVGVAVNHLKAQGMPAAGSEIATAVRAIRAIGGGG